MSVFAETVEDASPPESAILWRISPPVVRGLARAFFSLQIEQESELPDPPFVIAANHYSHFDSPLIGAFLDVRIRFMALEDLFASSRLLAWLATRYGAIPTPRDRVPIRAVRNSLKALEAGEVVALFPEGTRVSHWRTLPPKRGAAWMALRAGVPLVPVAAIGTGQVFGLENRLRRGRIRIVVGEPLQPQGDAQSLTDKWAAWVTEQIDRHPGSEVSGPRRAHFSG